MATVVDVPIRRTDVMITSMSVFDSLCTSEVSMLVTTPLMNPVG